MDSSERHAAPPTRLIAIALQEAAELRGLAGTADSRAQVFDCPPDYQVLREIRRGGQAVVFHAVDDRTGSEVAIKVYHLDRLDAAGWERARREADLLHELNHPTIVPILGSGQTGSRPFLVMPYIAGWSLDEFVRQAELAVAELIELFLRICAGVEAAHVNGVIHRDLKPSNIRIDETGHPFILDFGLARNLEVGSQVTVTHSSELIGSLPWAAPEQVDSRCGRIDIRTDVYALGAMLYFALTGQPPIPLGGSQRELLNRIAAGDVQPIGRIRRGVNADLDTVVRKCLQVDPVRRYQSVGALSADLERCRQGQPIAARRDSVLYLLTRQVRRHRWTSLLLLFTAASLLFGLAEIGIRWRQRAALADEARAGFTILAQLVDLGHTLLNKSDFDRSAAHLHELVKKLDARAWVDPKTECELRLRAADLLIYNRESSAASGQSARALQLATQSAAQDPDLLLRALNCRAGVLGATDPATSVGLLSQYCDLCARTRGTHHIDYWSALAQLAAQKATLNAADFEPIARRAIQLSEAAEPHIAAMLCKQLGEWLTDVQNCAAEGCVLHAHAVALMQECRDDEALSHYLHSYGHALRKAGALDEAVAVLQRAVTLRSAAYSRNDIDEFFVPVSRCALGEALLDRGDFEAARSELQDALLEFNSLLVGRHASEASDWTNRVAQCFARFYTVAADRWPQPEYSHAARFWRDRVNQASNPPVE